MGNIFNEDFRDFLTALNNQDVRYILVGGFSVILHGYSRTMPVYDMTEENFLTHPAWDVFTFGRPPVAIDIMVKVKGLDFDDLQNIDPSW